MKRYIVDRVEGSFIVCEDENGKEIHLSLALVETAKDGDCIVENDGVFSVDKAYTEERRKRIIALQNSLWE